MAESLVNCGSYTLFKKRGNAPGAFLFNKANAEGDFIFKNGEGTHSLYLHLNIGKYAVLTEDEKNLVIEDYRNWKTFKDEKNGKRT